jgi:hypothetical protein
LPPEKAFLQALWRLLIRIKLKGETVRRNLDHDMPWLRKADEAALSRPNIIARVTSKLHPTAIIHKAPDFLYISAFQPAQGVSS